MGNFHSVVHVLATLALTPLGILVVHKMQKSTCAWDDAEQYMMMYVNTHTHTRTHAFAGSGLVGKLINFIRWFFRAGEHTLNPTQCISWEREAFPDVGKLFYACKAGVLRLCVDHC